MAEVAPAHTEKVKPQVKHDWYQTETGVVITVFARNINPDTLHLNFTENKVEMSFKLEEDDVDVVFQLSHQIVPEECSYKITQAKIELKLKKLEKIRWTKLEGEAEVLKTIPVETAAVSDPLSYPTSKKGKDWAAIEKEIEAVESEIKPPEEEKKLVPAFQQISKKASDKVKIVKNKNAMESRRTVLSAEEMAYWKEVANKMVEVNPPEGNTHLAQLLRNYWPVGLFCVIVLFIRKLKTSHLVDFL